MKEQVYISSLYDYYGSLLTEKQQRYFEDYYFNNLSLSEISENEAVSRNAVHKTIKEVETKLHTYEKELKMYEKTIKINMALENINPKIKEEINKILEN